MYHVLWKRSGYEVSVYIAFFPVPCSIRNYGWNSALVLTISMGLLIGGCRSKQSQPTSSGTMPGITYTYHLRGIIRALPQPGQSPRSLSIKVEPIANWVGLSGKIEPMMAMTMPYQLAHGLPLKNMTVGDKVAFTYKVNWVRDRMVVTRISELPPQTQLDFSMPATTQAMK